LVGTAYTRDQLSPAAAIGCKRAHWITRRAAGAHNRVRSKIQRHDLRWSVTILAEQSTYGAPQAEVAWLEKALFLAAQELASFRASAATERERALLELRDVEARLSVLEAERTAAEKRHTAELERAQARFEAELAERAKAWSELGNDVGQRGDSSAAAHARLQIEIERAAQLGRELADSRAQLKEALEARAALLSQFATLEEQFAVAAVTTREAKEQSVSVRGQLDRQTVELDQSISRCRQLDLESRALASKLNERSEDIESAERAVVRLKQELSEAQSRISSLERAAAELQAIRPELDRERDMRKAAIEKLEKLSADLDAEKRRVQQAETGAFEAKRSGELTAVDLQGARRERDESRRELEAQRSKVEQLDRDLVTATQNRKASEREADLTRELESLRTERADKEGLLTRELDAARRDRDDAKRDQTQNKHELDARTQAELEAARKDRDEARRELAQAKREAESRVANELETLREERDVAKRELENRGDTLALVEQEKDRVAQLKVELDELRSELERTRSERETLREELAHQQRMAAGQSTGKQEPMRGPPSRVDREQQMTVPIPDRAPANEVVAEPAAPAGRGRKREGTSYSVNQVDEEQVFVRKGGGGGGRGNR
jgi:chromosome segregation ATPase